MNVNIKQNNHFVQVFIYSFVYLVRFFAEIQGVMLTLINETINCSLDKTALYLCYRKKTPQVRVLTKYPQPGVYFFKIQYCVVRQNRFCVLAWLHVVSKNNASIHAQQGSHFKQAYYSVRLKCKNNQF